MGVLDWFKTSEKAIDTAAELFKAGAEGIDNFHLSDEEKVKFAEKAYELWLKLQDILVQSGTGQALARRILAIITAAYYFGMGALNAFYTMLGVLTGNASWFLVGKQCYENMNEATGPFLLVMGFYFGPEMLGRLVGKIKGA